MSNSLIQLYFKLSWLPKESLRCDFFSFAFNSLPKVFSFECVFGGGKPYVSLLPCCWGYDLYINNSFSLFGRRRHP